MPENYYKFELMPLKYDYSALEPYIDTKTMRVHHDGHLKTYVDNLNKALENYPGLQKLSLEDMLKNTSIIPQEIKTAVINNGGGVYNHNFFLNNIRPGRENNYPAGTLSSAIEKQFGSFEDFKNKFTNGALAVFGSGYLWLVRNRNGKLMLFPASNQESPLSYGYCPILTIDLWEHAYYLKHQNLRRDYINNWWNVINWANAEENFINCMRR